MGITGGLNPEEYDRNYSDRELVRRIVRYFRPHIGKVLLVAAMVSLISILATATPILISRGIDTLGGQSAIAAFADAGGDHRHGSAGAGASTLSASGFRRGPWAMWCWRCAKTPFAPSCAAICPFDQFASGRIVSRVTSDTQDFATVVTLTIDLLSQLVLVVVIGLVLLTQNVPLALITFAVGPVVVIIALVFRRLARNAMQQAQRALATVNATIQETVSGIAVAKNFRPSTTIFRTSTSWPTASSSPAWPSLAAFFRCSTPSPALPSR